MTFSKSSARPKNSCGVCLLHISYVSGIERGQRNVRLVNIVKLARGLRVTMAELFRGIR